MGDPFRPDSAYLNSAIVPRASPLYVRHIPVHEPFTTPRSTFFGLPASGRNHFFKEAAKSAFGAVPVGFPHRGFVSMNSFKTIVVFMSITMVVNIECEVVMWLYLNVNFF